MNFIWDLRNWLIGICMLGLVSCMSNKPSADLVIRNVTLLDSRTGQPIPEQSVFIKDGMIADIRPYPSNRRANKVILGNGRLLSPGLIDAHVHFSHQFHPNRVLKPEDRERLARVYLNHGVTTIAEMGQTPKWVPTLVEWSNQIQSDAPNIILVAGSLCSALEWDTRPPPHHVILKSPTDATRQVRAYHDQGATRIKLYWKLQTPEMKAAIAEADRLNMSYYAHIDNGYVSVQEAMDLGVRNFEHFFTLQRSIEDPDNMVKVIGEEFPFEGPSNLDEWTLALVLYHDVIEQNPELRLKYDALLDRMGSEGAALSTAINMLAAAAGDSPVFSGFDPKPPRSAPQVKPNFLPEDKAANAMTSLYAQIRRAHEKGVKLHIGTDARNGGEVVLAEMELLARAGLPISEIFKIATINPAKALRIDDVAGQIAIGWPADLVLFNASPFVDPKNFRAGVTTFKNGVLYQPQSSATQLLQAQLREGGIDKARAWQRERGLSGLHPTELQIVAQQYLKEGEIDKAHFLLSLMQSTLSGEEVGDYVSDRDFADIGYEFYGAQDFAKAKQVFELAVEIHADSWRTHEGLGLSVAALGEYNASKLILNRALEINPDSPNALAVLRQISENETD